jgi:hypothetical protein
MSSGSAPSIVQIGAGTASPFPMFERIWEVFSAKGIRTVFVTIGNSVSSAADLDLAEAIGCPIHVVPVSSKGGAEWEELLAIVKEKKREGANAQFPFTEGAQQKWILPKNIRIQKALPFWHGGVVAATAAATPIPTIPVQEFVAAINAEMKLKDGESRVDILKIDTKEEWPGLEKGILAAVLDAGYRPGLVLVNWTSFPDTDLSTTLAAGHLQNAGYKLCGKEGSRFLYFFSDNDLYQVCSWEETAVSNPLFNEIGQQILAAHATAKVPSSEQKAAGDASA